MFKPRTSSHPECRAISRIPVDAITVGPALPRRGVTAESVANLAESIRRHGQLSPLLVRHSGEGFDLIAGQRRLRALKLLGCTEAEAVVLPAGDSASAMIALADNIQREPLHYLDIAEACRRILDSASITLERLAVGLGVSSSALSRALMLLRLSPRVRAALRHTSLTERHARVLLRLEDEQTQLELIRQAADRHMSARALDARVDARLAPRPTVSGVVRDNRIIINAVTDTVRQLQQIGVRVQSRVVESEDRIDVVVSIPTGINTSSIDRERPEGV